MMVKKKPIYLNSTNQRITPFTGVLLSNISNIVTQTGRPATVALRQCRPGQKTAQALVQTANCKPKAALWSSGWENSSAEREPGEQPGAAGKQRILIHSVSISAFYTTCWEEVMKGMFQIKSLAQVDIIVKAAEMKKWDEYELN